VTGRGAIASREGALAHGAALGVFLLALSLRLAWVVYLQVKHPGNGYYLNGDALEYTAVARNLLGGLGWWSPDSGGGPYLHGPVFPLFVAANLALGANLFAITVVQAFIGALTCWGVVWIGRKLTTLPGAISAGLLMAVYPYFLHYTGQILTETLSVFFGLAVFASLVLFARDSSVRNAVLAGLVLGVATLNHPETYVAPPLLILWVLVCHPRRRLGLRRLGILLAVFGLTLLPWHAYNALKNGRNLLLPPSLDAKGVLAQAALEARTRILGDPSYQEKSVVLKEEGEKLEEDHGVLGGVTHALGQVLDDLESNPRAYLDFIYLKFKRMWELAPERGTYAHPAIVIPTALLSALIYAGCLVGFLLHRRRDEVILALMLVAIYTLPHLVFYAQPRYRLPVMPAVMLFAGVGGGALLERIAGRRPVFAGGAAGDRRRNI
jgi:4-amino-4-deoxy-L-arabinose transferase-like glycosyltransferase